MRERSQPEYLYTAAAVAGFGAVCWGVAALDPAKYQNRFWTHPDMAAIVGVSLSAIAMIWKIVREHNSYRTLKKSRAKLAQQLKEIEGAGSLIPEDLLKSGSGGGYLLSSFIILTSAFGAAAFILALLLRP